jgi:hypothetical protein
MIADGTLLLAPGEVERDASGLPVLNRPQITQMSADLGKIYLPNRR